jgi:hypothetical protein
MACGVTMYGSVAHELAYCGTPSIACARHPHISFDFCRTARSKEEYGELLRTACGRPDAAEEMRRQALAFYYMRNLHGSADELELRDRFSAWWQACGRAAQDADSLVVAFRSLRDCEAFRSFSSRLIPQRPAIAS